MFLNSIGTDIDLSSGDEGHSRDKEEGEWKRCGRVVEWCIGEKNDSSQQAEDEEAEYHE